MHLISSNLVAGHGILFSHLLRLLVLDMVAHTVPQLRQITFCRLSHEHSRGVSCLRSSKNPLGQLKLLCNRFQKIKQGNTLDSAVTSGGQGKLIYFMSSNLVSAWSRTVNFNVLFLICSCLWYVGNRGSTVVKVLCYKSEGRWFDPSWCHWNFSLT